MKHPVLLRYKLGIAGAAALTHIERRLSGERGTGGDSLPRFWSKRNVESMPTSSRIPPCHSAFQARLWLRSRDRRYRPDPARGHLESDSDLHRQSTDLARLLLLWDRHSVVL